MKGAPAGLVLRYARSLFQVAVDEKAIDAVAADLRDIAEVLHASPEFSIMLLHPGNNSTRVRALAAALGKKLNVNPLTARFVNLLIDKDRLSILHSLPGAFDNLVRKYKGEVTVHVTTAVPVSDSTRQQIIAELTRSSKKNPVVQWTIDPALIGGLIVQWPDRVFDASLRRKISNLAGALAGRA